MKRSSTRFIGNTLVLATATALSTIATVANAAGLMSPAQGNLPDLEIRSHHVNVVIEDGYAVTHVDQVFHNPHNQPLEAIYSFPVPEKAAVGEFTYWIDGKPVTAEVMEREQARATYEQQKAQGRETALAEQDGYRSFDSSVYPVQPNADVRIRMVYLQPVHTDLGIGRYVYPLEEGGVDEQKLAFWNYNDEVKGDFSFKLDMRSSYPIDDFRLPAHPQAAVKRISDQRWQVSFGDSANGGVAAEQIQLDDLPHQGNITPASSTRLDEDVVVYWRHQQGLPGAVDMVTYRPEGSRKGTFMLTVTPGNDLSALQGGRDWVFVLDYSGSMQGKYHSLVEGVSKGLEKLNPSDRFRIVLFNNGASDLTNGYQAVTPDNVRHYISKLNATSPNGGTNLYAGLQRGYQDLDSDRPSAVLLVTDGVANVGVTEKKDFLKLLEKHDVRLYSFVMGNSANRPLLEGMAKISNGFALNVSNSDDMIGLLAQTANKLNHEAYRDIAVNIEGVKTSDVTPATIGSLYRGRQLTLFGHYWGDGPAEVTITGKVSGKEHTYRAPLQFPQQSTLNPELQRLWAFATIEGLQDRLDYLGEDADSEQAITDLALEYGLVTNYTSMIVVREDVFKQLGIDRKNSDRVAVETAARTQRSAQPVRDHRQDTSTPAFTGTRAYPSNGSGAMGPFWLLLLLPLLANRHKYKA